MLKNNPTSPGTDTTRYAMVSMWLHGIQGIRKTSGFPRVFNTYRFEMHITSMNNFYKYRNKQAYLWIFTNVFKSISFQKISDFLVVFKRYETFFFFKYCLWTHQHFTCWHFSKYLYSQGTSESKEIIFNDDLQFIYVRTEQFNFWECNV